MKHLIDTNHLQSIFNKGAQVGVLLRILQAFFLLWQLTYLQSNFSPEIVGTFYLVASLFALQLVGDLGLSQLTISMFTRNIKYYEALPQSINLKSLQRKISRNALLFIGLYIIISILYLIWFEAVFQNMNKLLLFGVIMFLSIDLYVLHCVAVRTAHYTMSLFYKYKLIRYFIEYLAVVVLFASYDPMHAQSIAVIFSVLFSLIVYFSVFRKFWPIPIYKNCGTEYNLLSEFVPMQVKFGLMWVAGFLTFSLIVPFFASVYGVDKAATAGTLIALFNGINMIYYTVVNSRSVELSQYSVTSNGKLLLKQLKYSSLLIFISYFILFSLLIMLSTFFEKYIGVISEDMITTTFVFLLFLVHALTIPFVVTANAYAKNNYYHLILGYVLVKWLGFYTAVYFFDLNIGNAMMVYAVLQIPVYLIIRNGVSDILS